MTTAQGRAGGNPSGFTVWFTGLSGSGKTTISEIVRERLRELGHRVELLDGDVVRTNLSKGLGFSKEDRDTNIRRIGWVCELLTRNDVVAIAAAISPYREVRDEIRAKIGSFIEVYVECPIETLADRDVKGLYRKALAGEITGFTGVDDPYEPPLNPEVTCYSDGRETAEQSAAKVLAKLAELGYLAAGGSSDVQAAAADEAYTPEEESEVSDRLRDLGYL
ncbi:MAG: adenylyl-sulfate kinase [Chloroflexota bacterium]|nr:adenylyl-sulfate kinase [Chloroflexota bacterium]